MGPILLKIVSLIRSGLYASVMHILYLHILADNPLYGCLDGPERSALSVVEPLTCSEITHNFSDTILMIHVDLVSFHTHTHFSYRIHTHSQSYTPHLLFNLWINSPHWCPLLF